MQTRYDLEFMADMLGNVEQKTIGGPADMRPRARYGFIPTEALATAVAGGMRDPIASARAQQRIDRLLHELPVAIEYAPNAPMQLPGFLN